MRTHTTAGPLAVAALLLTAGCGNGSGPADPEPAAAGPADAAAASTAETRSARPADTGNADSNAAGVDAATVAALAARVQRLEDTAAIHKVQARYAHRQSARSHWLSPGATGSNTSAGWVFGPYYVDYVKEDGEWRILHSNLAPVFRNPYDVSWAEATDNGTVRGVLSVEADEPSTLYRPYHEVKQEPDIFRDHPDLPEPY